ncbi:MAG: hypothetical protein EOP05_16525, partial [Proteobacteria bacterium]
MSDFSAKFRTRALLAAGVVATLTMTSVMPELSQAAPAKKTQKRIVKTTKTTRTTTTTSSSGSRSSSAGANRLDLNREKTALPSSQALKTPVATRSLGVVKPPRSNDFYQGNEKEAEYERLVDQEIKQLFSLSQANRRSPNRGEIWLRLGERYVEKARLIEFREQAQYDQKLKDFNEKKTRVRPRVDARLSQEYNKKAVELYEWFVADFPKDGKVDQALFFLGYNQFQLGNTELGEKYYV